MKNTILIILSFIYPIIGYGAVGDKFIAITEEGVSVKYTILSEPPFSGYPGTVSVGYSTENSNSCSVDWQTTEGVITIPQSVKNGNKRYTVTTVAAHAFGSCSLVTSIILPNSITEIGDYAFSGCGMLSNIILPDALTAVGKGAFKNCESLVAIAFPEGVKTIEENTFSNCIKLKDVLFNKVYIIRENAFSDCTALESLTFNRKMGIYSYAFNNCTSLNAVTFLHNELVWIQNYAFNGCDNLKSVYSHITQLAGLYDYSFYGINPDAILYVESEMKTAYENNYSWSRYFSSIRKFPLKLGDIISVNLFNSEDSLNVNAEVINTAPMTLCINSLVDVTQIETIKDLIIPSHLIAYDDIFFLIDRIGVNSFSHAKISTLIIEEGVRSIGKDAFSECISLTSVSIPQSASIIENAFLGCTNLNSVTVNWRNLSDVCIDEDNFTDISSDAILHVPAGTAERYAEHEVWGRFTQIIESGPISVGDISTRYGSKVNLPIYLKSDEEIAGLQFKLTLPNGVSVPENEEGLIATLTDRTEGMTVLGLKDSEDDNSYLFVLLSMDGLSISGQEGAIINIPLDIAPEMAIGNYETCIGDVQMATAAFETLTPANSTSDLKIQDYMSADVNGDNVIDALDASLILQYVAHKFGDENMDFIKAAADTNNDSVIDALDASLVLQHAAKKIDLNEINTTE